MTTEGNRVDPALVVNSLAGTDLGCTGGAGVGVGL